MISSEGVLGMVECERNCFVIVSCQSVFPEQFKLKLWCIRAVTTI